MVLRSCVSMAASDLIPNRCGDIIDRAPLIGPTDDVSSVEKIKLLGKS